MNDWREQLVAARLRRGMSVARLADIVGVHRSAVYRWESGERSPELDHLRRWAEALNVEVEVVVHAPDAPMRPIDGLVARLMRLGHRLDDRALRMLEAQVDVLGAQWPEDVKKTS